MKRELIVTVEGRDRAVVVDGPLEDGRFRISIDGAERRHGAGLDTDASSGAEVTAADTG